MMKSMKDFMKNFDPTRRGILAGLVSTAALAATAPRAFALSEDEAKRLIELDQPLPLPSYEMVLKASHTFNLLDARKAIGVNERTRYIGRIRNIARKVAEAFVELRESMGHPLIKK